MPDVPVPAARPAGPDQRTCLHRSAETGFLALHFKVLLLRESRSSELKI